MSQTRGGLVKGDVVIVDFDKPLNHSYNALSVTENHLASKGQVGTVHQTMHGDPYFKLKGVTHTGYFHDKMVKSITGLTEDTLFDAYISGGMSDEAYQKALEAIKRGTR